MQICQNALVGLMAVMGVGLAVSACGVDADGIKNCFYGWMDGCE
jgi:hypothetical protein